MTHGPVTGPDPLRLMLAGDWHRNARWALRVIDHAHDNDVDTIVQLGDFGFWPDRKGRENYVKQLAERLDDRGIRLFWLDGNHENHAALDAGRAADLGPILHLPRAFRWRWWNKDWMAVGGGVSIDKSLRRPGIDWFDREVLSAAEFEQCCRPGNVDIVVSHDCPAGVRIPGFHAEEKQGIRPSWFSPEAIAESEAHRALIAEICESIRPDYLFHGHYHSAYCSEWNFGVQCATYSVGTQQDPVERSEVNVDHGGIAGRRHAHEAGEAVAPGMVRKFLGSDSAGIKQHLSDGVVRSQTRQPIVTQQIRPAVAQIDKGATFFTQQQCHNRCGGTGNAGRSAPLA